MQFLETVIYNMPTKFELNRKQHLDAIKLTRIHTHMYTYTSA